MFWERMREQFGDKSAEDIADALVDGAAHGDGSEIRADFRDRHGMRLRPPQARDHSRALAHPCRGGKARLTARSRAKGDDA